MPRTPVKELNIIGGGLVGASLARKIADNHAKTWQQQKQNGLNPAELTIRIIDPAGEIGRGKPYARISENEATNRIATNNQHNDNMGTDADQPDNFTRHLDPDGSDPNTQFQFAARVDTGDFATTLVPGFNAFADERQIRIRIEHIQARATDVTVSQDPAIAPVIRLDTGRQIDTGLTIIADGHQSAQSMPQLQDTTGFYGHYGDKVDGEMKDRLSGNTGEVLHRGTSQSFVDNLRLLEHLGFQGTHHAVSRNGYMPWEFNPHDYPEGYDKIEFTPESMLSALRTQNVPAEQIIAYLENTDMQNGAKEGVGRAMVYKHAIDALREFSNENPDHPALSQVFVYLKSAYGNPTPKASADLIDRLQQEGRLKVHKDSITARNLRQTAAGFEVTGNKLDGLNVRAVFDGAIYARDARNPSTGTAISPLLNPLEQQGLLIPKDTAPTVYQAGQQNHPLLHMADGPATHDLKWGIGTFRKGNKDVAAAVCETYIQSPS